MIIQMSNKEFQELRKFIVNMKNPEANKAFNKIFAKEQTSGVKGFVNPINQDIVIHFPEHMTIEVEKVLVNYSPDIAKMVKGGASITNAPKWLSCIKNIFADIAKAFNK